MRDLATIEERADGHHEEEEVTGVCAEVGSSSPISSSPPSSAPPSPNTMEKPQPSPNGTEKPQPSPNTTEKPQPSPKVMEKAEHVTQAASPPSNGGDGDVVTVTTTLVSPMSNPDDLALLAKLEEANRQLEKNRKCMQTLQMIQMNKSSNNSAGHSRKGSDTSMISTNSASSSFQADDDASPDDLWNIWGKLVNDWDNQRKKRPNYIRDLVRKGIPVHFRGIAWQLMCTAHHTPYKEQYAEYIKQSSPQEKVIRRDITRTYPEHEFFKEKNGLGQESLFNVMKAYSLHDREVGYCQGSGFIVGLLLMQMPEEEAFAVLVQLMAEYRLRELFKPSMAELGLMMFQLECMIQEQLPDLYIHFQSQNIYLSMFASPWFLTLFTTVLPLHAACRVFDVFLSEGVEMVFRVGFAILYLNYDELLNLDLEGSLKFFQKTIPAKYDTDIDILMSTAFQVKYNPKRMKKLEKEYNALKSKEHEDQVELRRLRTENRLLRQRIENLEKETGTLADRLIQDQVIRAQREEENFTLRRDLCSLKTQNATKSQKLEDTQEELRSIKERASVVASQSVYSKLPSADDRERQQQLESTIRSQKQQIDDHVATMKQLQSRVRELEHINNQLQTDPSEEIQQLQEELIACKLREAEANRSMQELRQRVNDLEKYWQKFQEKANAPEGASGKVNKDKLKSLQEEVMNVRLREAQAIAELQEMKQKVMELETESHIHNRQIKRQDDENQKLQERLETKEGEEKSLQDRIKELLRQVTDLETKRKEDVMMARIKDAEHSQTIAEMRQRIAELEIENQELVTAGQLQEKGEAEALDTRIASLQEELMQLKMNKRLASISSLALNHSVDTESDYDTDDMDMDKDRLLLSSSMTGSINIDGYPLHDIAKLRLGPDFNDSSENEDDPTTAVRASRKKRTSKSKSNGDAHADLTKRPDDLEGTDRSTDAHTLLGVTRNSDGHSDGASTLSGDDKDNQSVDSGELTLTANTPMSPTAPNPISNGALIEDFTAVD